MAASALLALAPSFYPEAAAQEVAPADAERLDAQIRILKDRLYGLDYGDHAGRASLLREIADLTAQRFGPVSGKYAVALGMLALEYREAGMVAEEIAALRETLAVRKAIVAGSPDPRRAPPGDWTPPRDWELYAANNLAFGLEKYGRYEEAAALLRRYVTDPANDRTALFEAPFKRGLFYAGPTQYIDKGLNWVESRYAANVLANGGDTQTALFAAQQAMTSARLYRRHLGTSRYDDFLLASNETPLLTTNDIGEESFGDFARLYADAAWTAGARDPATSEDVFLALQDITLDRTTRALGQAAATRVALRHNARPLLERRAALTLKAQELTEKGARESALLSQAEEDALSAEANALDAQRDELDKELGAIAPEYFALTRPRPLSVAEVQALLKPGEVALMVMPARFGTHAILIDAAGISWHRSDLTATAVNGHVRRLLWDVGGNIEVTAEEQSKWSAEGEGLYPFDRTTAHLLYRELVAPFDERLKAARFLYIVSSGSLSSLPFSLLVTSPPQGKDGDPAALRATRWLGDRHALLQLPSLQSLQLLRTEEKQAKRARKDRLVGFGDPVLDGEAVSRGGNSRTRGSGSGASMASIGFNSSLGGQALADPGMLRSLARLPGTARELKALESAFGSDRSRIVLADAASESAFKRADLTGLSVLALSTHGLVAGEAGAGEPGLVFTPPLEASEKDDGYLSASEVAALDIEADWVILSACNTAAGDGTRGATGLSGLVRAFFFAGGRSVLASHWPVKDAVAEKMIPLVLSLQRQNPGWTRAEALQAAQRAIRDDTTGDEDLESWAHPSAWAPFTLIGDGAD